MLEVIKILSNYYNRHNYSEEDILEELQKESKENLAMYIMYHTDTSRENLQKQSILINK
jgi:hypothetical protein